MEFKKFAILITTKNRVEELSFTLSRIANLIDRNDVECIIVDDGSTDGTSEFILKNYPKIQLHRNEKSKGLMVNRNMMLNSCTAEFAISLDDDAHFLTKNPLELIEDYFDSKPKVAVLALRIFWGRAAPNHFTTAAFPMRVKSFVGCAHVWRTAHWNQIPDYPEWFEFHGEEDFASYQLFKKNLEVHYFPAVLTNHRVDLKARKKDGDYTLRLRRSLRSGWYLYKLFLPTDVVSRKLASSVKSQLIRKVFKGDFRAFKALMLAGNDLLKAKSNIRQNANRLTIEEYNDFQKLPPAQIYWNEEN